MRSQFWNAQAFLPRRAAGGAYFKLLGDDPHEVFIAASGSC